MAIETCPPNILEKPRQHLPERPSLSQPITIIGSGIAGCVSAWVLSEAGYPITIIEELDEPFNGTSKGALGIHLGGRYPKSWETATECLNSGILMKKLMPFAFGTDTLRFLVAEGSDTDFPTYLNFYEQLKQYYASLPEQDQVFGPPDEFYRILSPQELANFNHIQGGIVTQEGLFDMQKTRKVLLDSLAARGTTIITATEVQSVEQIDNGYLLSLKDSHTNKTAKHYTHTLINAGGYNARSIDQQVGETPLVKLDLRAFVNITVDEGTQRAYPYPFVVIPGVMHYVPFGNGVSSLVGFSAALDTLVSEENCPIHVPDDWKALFHKGAIDNKQLAQDITTDARENFMPLLSSSTTLHDMEPGIAVSFNHEQFIKKQHSIHTREDLPHYFSIIPTKASHALPLALQLLQVITHESLKSGIVDRLSEYTTTLLNGGTIAYVDSHSLVGDDNRFI